MAWFWKGKGATRKPFGLLLVGRFVGGAIVSCFGGVLGDFFFQAGSRLGSVSP